MTELTSVSKHTKIDPRSHCGVLCLLDFVYKKCTKPASNGMHAHRQTNTHKHAKAQINTPSLMSTHAPLAAQTHTLTRTYRWPWSPSWPRRTRCASNTLKETEITLSNCFYKPFVCVCFNPLPYSCVQA